MVGKNRSFLFTSESVSAGHPDKLCDQISDVILDFFLSKNPYERVAVESFALKDRVYISGEVSKVVSKAENLQIEQIVRNLIKEIGYEQTLFHWQNIEINIDFNQQSKDIAVGVDESGDKDEGAGDQGIMFGYACDDTASLMPAPIYYSHLILKTIFQDIKIKKQAGKAIQEEKIIQAGEIIDDLIYLGPDAKAQVTFEYDGDNRPTKVRKIVVSIQHHFTLPLNRVKEIVKIYIKKLFPTRMFDENTELFVNPTGIFTIGGPEGDVGLTGRKIIVDTYGGSAPHGGGAFSGKDPTKVDRSATYIARYLAKNIVASKVARNCLIQISYAIGVADPLSFYIKTDNDKIDHSKLGDFIQTMVSLKPKAIREYLELNRPIYLETATYGHFGREPKQNGCFSWEKVDIISAVRDSMSEFKI